MKKQPDRTSVPQSTKKLSGGLNCCAVCRIRKFLCNITTASGTCKNCTGQVLEGTGPLKYCPVWAEPCSV